MRIGSIVINGLDRVGYTLLREFEIVKESGDRMGAARMIILYNPSDSVVAIEPGQQIDIYRASDEEASSAETLFGSTTSIFGEPLFGEATPSEKIFSGQLVNVEPQVMVAQRNAAGSESLWGEVEFESPLFGEAPGTERVNCVRIEARDNNYILESTIVTELSTGITDKAKITAMFAGLPTIDITDVASTATLSSLPITDETLRSAVQKITERTGAVDYIDANLAFHYFLPALRPAPFSLSESPDLVSSFPFERQTFRFTKEWRAPANRVTVIGKVGTAGSFVSRTRNDAVSQSLYGLKAITIVDRQISTNGEADARGDVELANRANPQYGGTLVTYVDGLEVGQYLTINAGTTLSLNGPYTIRRISMRWLNKQTTRYEIEWGAYQPDIARTLQALYQATLDAAALPVGLAPPSTIGTGEIIPGSVTGGSGGSLAGATITQANMGNASIGQAQIQNAAIVEAHIQDAQITNAKIVSLSALKINTDDLLIGGSGKVGQIVIYNASNAPFGWFGRNGSDYGGWMDTLWVGGTGPSTAKFKSVAGDITVQLDSSDTFTMLGSGHSISFHIDAGIAVLQVDSTDVVGPRKTGWQLMSGTTTRNGSTYNTATITLPQLAEQVRGLIQDLALHGLIGA